ncbi:hypothetical protein WDW89_01935 [Deltaproteobacteria bacterium TL4]
MVLITLGTRFVRCLLAGFPPVPHDRFHSIESQWLSYRGLSPHQITPMLGVPKLIDLNMTTAAFSKVYQ